MIRIKYKSILFILSLLLILQLVSFRGLRISINVKSFYKPPQNPVLSPDSSYTFIDPITKKLVKWQKADVFNAAAIVKDGKIVLLYRAEDNPIAAIGDRTSRLGLAESTDGIHFRKFPTPVLYPGNDKFMPYDYPGGCEDPRLVQTMEGMYVVMYTAWNNKTARLSTAFSDDLLHWTKNGPAFNKKFEEKFINGWSKSGSVITEIKNGKQVAARINGKYWMYWGEHFINLARSYNLYDWNPMLTKDGALLAVAAPRSGMFDSDLTECGPPAIITEKGIELFYNGKNTNSDKATPLLPKGTYSTGEIIFDTNNPAKIIYRSDTCFLKPSLHHEISGQYKAGTTFAEGLVYFKHKWFLYYGTADSFVGVAIAKTQ